MYVIQSVRNSRAQLPIRNPPIDGIIIVEENSSEFPGGIKVRPIDTGAAIGGVENIGMKRGV
jgi:hypothetical protein